MNKVVSRCPVCGKELIAVRLKCEHCDTAIENSFRLSRFDYLSDEDLAFVETFLRCRGSLKEVQAALGISYPTVRGRLDTVLKRMGLYEAGEEERARSARKEDVLKALETGEITPEQALQQLRGAPATPKEAARQLRERILEGMRAYTPDEPDEEQEDEETDEGGQENG